MSEPTILVIDDDAELQSMLAWLLQQQGWQTQSALTAQTGERMLADRPPDVILLDRMLPDMDGVEACRQWKARFPDLPVLMLSARGELDDRVLSLDSGADDFLAKPFAASELIARMRALLRRASPKREAVSPPDDSTAIAFSGLRIDLIRREALAGDVAVMLTRVEFRLLVALASQPGKILSREDLHAAIQPGAYRPMDRTVDVQVLRVRRKLMTAAPGTEWIRTVRGVGYSFSTPSSTADRV